jgi:hypothetical protein
MTGARGGGHRGRRSHARRSPATPKTRPDQSRRAHTVLALRSRRRRRPGSTTRRIRRQRPAGLFRPGSVARDERGRRAREGRLGRTPTLDRFRRTALLGLGPHGLNIASRRRPRSEDRRDALQAGNRSAQRPPTIGIASRSPSTAGQSVSVTSTRPGLETLPRSRTTTGRVLSLALVGRRRGRPGGRRRRRGITRKRCPGCSRRSRLHR